MEPAMWSRAAIAAAILKDFGKDGLEALSDRTGWSRSSVYQLARVFKSFPPSSRCLDLSFHVHAEALRAKDPVDALAKADAEGWSVRMLRERLEDGTIPARRPRKPKVAPAEEPTRDGAAALTDAAEEAQRRREAANPDPDALLEPTTRRTRMFEVLQPVTELYVDWPDGTPCDEFIEAVRDILKKLEILDRKARGQ